MIEVLPTTQDTGPLTGNGTTIYWPKLSHGQALTHGHGQKTCLAIDGYGSLVGGVDNRCKAVRDPIEGAMAMTRSELWQCFVVVFSWTCANSIYKRVCAFYCPPQNKINSRKPNTKPSSDTRSRSSHSLFQEFWENVYFCFVSCS